MKKMISFLLLLGATLAFGQVVPVDTKKPKPIVIEPFDPTGMAYSEKIYDFELGNNGTTTDSIIGNVFDIRKLALVRHYDATAAGLAAVVTMDSLLGQMTVSCYDLSDSSGQTDSVAFVLNLQGSDFASNNSDPNTPYSDAWYTIRAFTMLGTSAAQAQVTADTVKVKLPLSTHTPQFIRVYGSNLSYVAQNDMRCRVILGRPRYFVH